MNVKMLALAAAGALLIGGCAGPGAVSKPAVAGQVIGKPAPGPFTANGSADATSGRVKTELLDSMKFAPNELKAKVGQTVAVEMKNSGHIVHNFVSPSLGVEDPVKVDGGKSGTVTFTAPTAPGSYQFWCNEPGHAEAGMVGRVVVTE